MHGRRHIQMHVSKAPVCPPRALFLGTENNVVYLNGLVLEKKYETNPDGSQKKNQDKQDTC